MNAILNEPYQISQEAIDFYQKNRFIKLKNVFDAESLTHYGEKITQLVAAASADNRPLDQRDTVAGETATILAISLP